MTMLETVDATYQMLKIYFKIKDDLICDPAIMVSSRNRFRNLLHVASFGIIATFALGIFACDSNSDSDDKHNTTDSHHTDTSTLTDSTLDTTGGESGTLFSIGNIVMKPDGDRTLYVQTVSSLAGPELTSDQALEFHGNSRHWAYNGAVYIGSGEAPTITKLVPDATGHLLQSAQVNFLNQGLAADRKSVV